MDAGLKSVGADCICAIEQDADCCATMRLNGYTNVISKRIEEIRLDELRKDFNLTPGSIDLVVGGPPCQPFSKSALWNQKATQGIADQRSSTLEYYVEFIREFAPRAFILENVEGFVRWGGLALLQDRLASISHIGIQYSLAWKIVDAADFGVPQNRRRFIAIGMKGDSSFNFPLPTHGKDRLPKVTSWEAINSLQNNPYEENLSARGRWSELLPSIPAGTNYLWHTERGGGLPLFGWRTRYWSFLLKLSPNHPSPTIVANPSQNSGPFHWENRLLSTQEMAAIQTFPKSYRFAGNRLSRQRQIGNAVPVLLAAQIGASLAVQLGYSVERQQFYSPNDTLGTPVIPRVSEVPEIYRSRIGHHAAHPGTGLGPKPRQSALSEAVGLRSRAVKGNMIPDGQQALRYGAEKQVTL